MTELPNVIHQSWHPFLQPLFDQDFSLNLLKNQILPKCIFFPEAKNIFRVFSMPMQQVKIVILGQDPYPTRGHANGYAFAVNQESRMPVSLKIIAKEVENEGLKSGFYDSDVPHWRTLESWTEQGVFLLNTALTVQEGKAGSHLDFWKPFTYRVITTIAREVSPIWMLWGKKAQEIIPLIIPYREADKSKNVILTAPHPAAESYSGGKAGFYGCNHFNIANNVLAKSGNSTINF